MKTFKVACDQGELSFIKISDECIVPDNGVRVNPVGVYVIIGHSETGHHHVMLAEKTEAYKLSDEMLRLQLIVKEPDNLTHLRDFDTHEPIRFERGTYRVTNLREHTPEGWRRQAD